MNNLTKLYHKIKDFADGHNMVNEFFLANTEDDLNQREFNFRTLALLLLEANISRDLNSPVYTLDFGAIVIDKIGEDDDFRINNVFRGKPFCYWSATRLPHTRRL